MTGISLTQGTTVVLAIDGTLVYVESIEPIYIAVVALPEQPARKDDRVFTPGRVGVKKISPFSQAEKEVRIADLSERNQKFLQTYKALRKEHGANHVNMTEEERSAMTVIKIKPGRKSKSEPKCNECHEQSEHQNHQGDDGHEFVEPKRKARA